MISYVSTVPFAIWSTVAAETVASPKCEIPANRSFASATAAVVVLQETSICGYQSRVAERSLKAAYSCWHHEMV